MVINDSSDIDESWEDDCVLFVTNVPPRVTEELLYELFLQVGPVAGVSLKEGSTYAYIHFEDAESVPYSIAMLSGITLFGQQISLRPTRGSIHNFLPNFYLEALRSYRDRVTSGNGGRTANGLARSGSQPIRNGMGSRAVGNYAGQSSRSRFRRSSWPQGNGHRNDHSPNGREMGSPVAHGHFGESPRATADRSLDGSPIASTSTRATPHRNG
uniref:RRM domain-containing protein n=1 Tax=Trichuris muris TaxID=70415 RepID=A0A5S6Q7Q3_TRIMR